MGAEGFDREEVPPHWGSSVVRAANEAGTVRMSTGPRGFEPLILRLRAACSTGLSYGPTDGSGRLGPER
jgi:hypothetical protein